MAEHARALGLEPGDPIQVDDHYETKCELIRELRPDVVSFAFGLPRADVVDAFHTAQIPVVVTVESVAEAAGVDAPVLQGYEAGGHRGGFDDDGADGLALLSLLRLTSTSVDIPLIAAGGLADGAGVATVLAAGASAAMLGTAFLRCPEAGTTRVHADSLASERPTVVTRAFTGRSARAIDNAFTDRFTDSAPSAYPEIHYLTSPIRARARQTGDAENLNLWAGQAHTLANEAPAGRLVRQLAGRSAHA